MGHLVKMSCLQEQPVLGRGAATVEEVSACVLTEHRHRVVNLEGSYSGQLGPLKEGCDLLVC